MTLYYLLSSDPRHPSVLHSGLAPAGSVLRPTEHVGKLLCSLMCLFVYLTCLSKIIYLIWEKQQFIVPRICK